MNGPSKILPFRRPDHPIALHLVRADAETFPRFRHEWNRPGPPPGPHPHDPAATPPAGK
jgi:hypothetical protein